jgi:hypothetical protein
MATTPGAVTCDFLVLDGDSSCKNTIEKVVPGVKSVACFNHYTKALYKRLSAKFKLSQRVVKKAVKATKTTPAVAAVVDICRCKGTHKWTGKHCGCANDKTAKHIQSLVFAAGVKAGKDAAVFKRLVDEILLHMRGDHSTCTFHSKLQDGRDYSHSYENLSPDEPDVDVDNGVAMVKMGNVPDSARVVVNSTRGILLFIDIEHEGWGPYYSRITELCTKAVVFNLANEEGGATGSWRVPW